MNWNCDVEKSLSELKTFDWPITEQGSEKEKVPTEVQHHPLSRNREIQTSGKECLINQDVSLLPCRIGTFASTLSNFIFNSVFWRPAALLNSVQLHLLENPTAFEAT